MKNKIAIGIAITTLLLVILAFSGCVEEETPESTETNILPPKTALQPGVYDVSELSHLPMTISLGNDTYLVLTDADKERISGYFENKGRYPSSFDFELIFRDKNGKVVNKGVQEIRVKYGALKSEEREYDMRYLRKIPVYVEIPLDFFETWEVRGSSYINPSYNLLSVRRSQEVKLSACEYGGEDFVELTGKIDVKRSGEYIITATLVGNIESNSDKKLIAKIGFEDSNNSVYEVMNKEQRKSTIAYLYLEPFESRSFEAHFSTLAYETDELFRLSLSVHDVDKYTIPAEHQDRIVGDALIAKTPIIENVPIIKLKAEVTVTDGNPEVEIVSVEQDAVHPLKSPKGSSTVGFPSVDAMAIINNAKISYWAVKDYHGEGTYDFVIGFSEGAALEQGDMVKVIVKVVDGKGRTLATDIRVITWK